MDAKSRAEKIFRAYDNIDDGEELLVVIAAQIEEAEREAVERKDKKAISCSHCSGALQSFQLKWYRGCLCECHVGTYEDAYAEGYAAAREQAALICDDEASIDTDQAATLVMKIRQMKGDA